MPIIKKNEAMPQRPVVILIYGMPGTGKTSLFNTSKNCLLIDCDRGADRAINRQDTVICNSWEDIIAEEKAGSFAPYDTIGIDTAKACLDDFLMDYVKKMDVNCAKNQLKAYGAIGQEFKEFISRLRSMKKDLVIIAHAKDDKDMDVTRFYPDVTGGSKDLLLRMSDQVGFMSVVNQKRTIRFEPDDRIIGKNVARLPLQNIPLDGTKEFPDCLDRIIKEVKARINDRTNEQVKTIGALSEIEDILQIMDSCTQANQVFDLMKKLPKADKAAMGAKLKAKCEELHFEWDKENNTFVCIG